MEKSDINVSIIREEELASTDIEGSIFELNKQIDMLSSHADQWDYFVAVSSGIICGMLDIFWVGEFNLARGRQYAQNEVEGFVKKSANLLGYKDNDLKGAVKFLEDRFPIPADGNTPQFGGGLQHHLRDFAHHPTPVGLIFSLLTQFTGMSYGTDETGVFIVVPVPDRSKVFIGDSIPDKIFRGTVIWLFHLISDIAGSSATAALSGGTGIPGPILSVIKEVSALPFMKNVCVDEKSLSVFLSKLFNGTLLAQHDSEGKRIKGTELKLDFRGELGALVELGRQALPVIANECIVRTFFFVRRFAGKLKDNKIKSINDFQNIDWRDTIPFNNPTVSRMVLVSSSVFTAIDLTEAIATEKYFVSVNYVGIGRFTLALGSEIVNCLKVQDVKAVRKMYETIRDNTYSTANNKIYGRIRDSMNVEKFSLTKEQTEILYNIELNKTLNDLERTDAWIDAEGVKRLKHEWVNTWKHYIEVGFPGFMQDEKAEMHWYEPEELAEKIHENKPEGVWYRLVLLEAMAFEPYFALSFEKDKNGKVYPGKKFESIKNSYKEEVGDKFLDEKYLFSYVREGYVARLRRTYKNDLGELNEVLKSVLNGIAVWVGLAMIGFFTGAMLAPTVMAILGAHFVGLYGPELVSTCLAYLGGGAVSVSENGNEGGTTTVVGGISILGASVGAEETVKTLEITGKESAIKQSAKLLVAFKEIFLMDEHDIEYAYCILDQYYKRTAETEKKLVDLKLWDLLNGEKDKEERQHKINNLEESSHVMEIALKNMYRFKTSYDLEMR